MQNTTFNKPMKTRSGPNLTHCTVFRAVKLPCATAPIIIYLTNLRNSKDGIEWEPAKLKPLGALC